MGEKTIKRTVEREVELVGLEVTGDNLLRLTVTRDGGGFRQAASNDLSLNEVIELEKALGQAREAMEAEANPFV